MINLSSPRHYVVSIAALFVIAGGIKLAASIITPFLLSVFIVLLFLPLLHWLVSRRAPILLAVGIVSLALFCFIGVIGALMYFSYLDIKGSLAFLQRGLDQLSSQIYQETGLEVHPDKLFDFFGGTGNFLFGAVKGATNTLRTFGFVVLITIFVFLEMLSIHAKLVILAGNKKQERIDQIKEITRSVSKYILVKTLASAATGGGIGISLSVMGVQNAVALGFIAFVLNYIPTIGSIIAAIPALILAYLQSDSLYLTLYVLGVYVFFNTIIGVILEPRVLGNVLGLSPFVILMSLVLWSFLLGPIGAFICIPLTRVIAIAFQHSNQPNLQHIAFLLSNLPDKHPEISSEIERLRATKPRKWRRGRRKDATRIEPLSPANPDYPD